MSSTPAQSAPDWSPGTAVSDRPLFEVTYARLSDEDAHYRIPAHVYVCATHEGGVVLDLRHDKYFGLTRSQMHCLHTVVQEWPAMNLSASSNSPPQAEVDALARMMQSRGLVTEEKNGAALANSPWMRIDNTMTDLALDDQPVFSIRPHHVCSYARSILLARWMLRRHTLEHVAKRIAKRREKAFGSSGCQFDPAKAAELTNVFRILKTLTHRGRGKCLLDSLALLEFLACYGLHPRWVIGVTTGPFSAHSWVQEQHYILGGSPEQTSFAFTPIMIV